MFLCLRITLLCSKFVTCFWYIGPTKALFQPGYHRKIYWQTDITSEFIRGLGSDVIVIDRWKGGEWRSTKRQIECNIMVERSQKLGVLTGNSHTDLNKISKIWSVINTVIVHQKKVFRYVSSASTWPCSLRQVPSNLSMCQGSGKTTEPLTELDNIVLITSFRQTLHSNLQPN